MVPPCSCLHRCSVLSSSDVVVPHSYFSCACVKGSVMKRPERDSCCSILVLSLQGMIMLSAHAGHGCIQCLPHLMLS